MVEKPKPFLYKVIAGPEDFTSSSLETKIVGAFNPGVATIKKNGKEKTVLMIRIAEAPKKEPKNTILLPYFSVENKHDSKFEVKFDKVDKKDVKIGRKDVSFKNKPTRLRHISYPIVALSDNGIDIDWKEDKPSFYPCYEHERFGIEDVRIVEIEKGYLLTYVSPHRDFGVSTSIALTEDFKTFKRFPFRDTPRPIFTGVKDIIPFPEKVPSTQKDTLGERCLEYAALTRFSAFADYSKPGVWVSYSPDLIHWGNDHRIILTENAEYSGTGPAVVKLDDMWLGVYHETEKKRGKVIYRGALFGLDLENPWKLLYKTPAFIEPNEHDRKPGFSPNTVYPTGLVVKEGVASIYSGEDDSYTSVRQYYLDDLVKFLKENSV